MNQVTFDFQSGLPHSIWANPELEVRAIKGLHQLGKAIPDSTELKWTFGVARKTGQPYAELVLERFKNFRLKVREENPNLIEAVRRVVSRLESILVCEMPEALPNPSPLQ